MKRIMFSVFILSAAMACLLLLMRSHAKCQVTGCCENCRGVYSSCVDNYEKQLFSQCHTSCGKNFPGDREGFSSCLDNCYLEMEKLIEDEGYPACKSQFVECGKKCGGCPGGE